MVNNLVSTNEAQNGFYPTPKSVAYQLFDMMDLKDIVTVLEPSAGKGDLIKAFGCYRNEKNIEYYESFGVKKKEYKPISCNVDAIEFDPNLRAILTYEFCGQRVQEFNNRISELNKERRYEWQEDNYEGLTYEQIAELQQLKQEVKERSSYVYVKVIHNDFLTFASPKPYNLILMNPPFANGDDHLIKAIQMQQKNGGKILCILNAETVLNLYSNKRKVLMQTLNNLGAKIKFVDNAFSNAERQTDVRVALIAIDIPAPEIKSDIYEKFRKGREYEETTEQDSSKLTSTNFVENIVGQYNEELELGLRFLDEYKALYPYLRRDMSGNPDSYSGLSLTIGNENAATTDMPKSKYVSIVRRKYWTSLLNNESFTGMLTKNLKDKYSSMIDKFIDYDFSIFNIQQLLNEMNDSLQKGVEETVIGLFEKLSCKYSYIPEGSKNIHYYNGWKTNKAHVINKKVILPCNGAFSDWKWDKNPLNVHNCIEFLSDIQKALNYLDGGRTDDINLNIAMTKARDEHNYRNIDTKYFYVTFFKRGTCHLVFKDEELLERFNAYVGVKLNYLPPCYGKKHYRDMNDEEKSVIDSFQGEKKYEIGMKNGLYIEQGAILQIGQ